LEAKRIDRLRTVAHALRRLRPLPGDILLFHHPERLRSHLITLFTRSPYYHVALYAGRGDVIEARIPRVVRRNLFTQKDGFRFVVLRAPSRASGRRALAWAERRLGAPYDLRSVSLWVLGRILHLPTLCRKCSESQFVCGNFVVQAFAAAGINLFPGRPSAEIVPADFGPLVHQMRRAVKSPPKEVFDTAPHFGGAATALTPDDAASA
jgi:hypothetical protein